MNWSPDQDGGAERRDLEGVAAARHERDRDAQRRRTPSLTRVRSGSRPGFWPQMLNGDSRLNWKPIVWS